ncbi:MAG: uroporphyrinogen-III synthase [Acidimicrobiales bacterium]|nr:uroporphyrinogen-III synthase [Acidimicrobiales bacterium]
MMLSPLEGFTVGVTADRRWSEQADLLRRRGASVVHGATIGTDYQGSEDELRAATEAFVREAPSYLLATTGIGVRAWVAAAREWGLSEELHRVLAQARILVRGPKTAAALRPFGLEPWAQSATERLSDLVARLLEEPLAGRMVAIQHTGERDGPAVEALSAIGATVLEVPVYRWRLPPDELPAVRLIEGVCRGEVDAVTFTSAPAVRNLMMIAEHHGLEPDLLSRFNERGAVAACVGPVCAEAARGAGITSPAAPGVGRLGLLVRMLCDALAERRRVFRAAGRVLVLQGSAVAVDQQVVRIAPRERAILDVLARRPGAVVAKGALVREIWGPDGDPHALETTVGRLRRRLGPAAPAIRAVRGRGYALDVAVGSSAV